jgi:hypothetical protein
MPISPEFTHFIVGKEGPKGISEENLSLLIQLICRLREIEPEDINEIILVESLRELVNELKRFKSLDTLSNNKPGLRSKHSTLYADRVRELNALLEVEGNVTIGKVLTLLTQTYSPRRSGVISNKSVLAKLEEVVMSSSPEQ